MTITMTDVLSTLPDTHVRERLAQAVEALRDREARERSLEAAKREAVAAAMRGIAATCIKQLPHMLALHAAGGQPDGWTYPPAGNATYFVEIAIPGLAVPLRARFEYVNGSRAAEWRFVTYLLPALRWHSSQAVWDFEASGRARANDVDTALANLVYLEAEYRTALESAQPERAAS